MHITACSISILVLNAFLPSNIVSGEIINLEAEKHLNPKTNVLSTLLHDELFEKRGMIADNMTLVSAYNFFITPISIGTPPQSLEVAIDTGSPYLWIFGPNTSFGGSERFRPNESSTFAWDDRAFRANYGAGSVEGEWASDEVYIGNEPMEGSIDSFPFGVVEAFDLNAGVPGLLGIGLGAHLHRDYQNVPEALYVTNITTSPAFAVHINSNNSGDFIFGGYDKSKVDGPFYEFDIATVTHSAHGASSYYYQLMMTSVLVNDVPFRAYGTAILDTGSPFLLLPRPIVDKLGKSLGFEYSNDVNAYYAPKDYRFNQSYVVSIQFGLFRADIPISDLIVPTSYIWAENTDPVDCIALATLGSSRYIIGDPFFRHSYSIFDSWNKKIYLAKSRSTPAESSSPVESSCQYYNVTYTNCTYTNVTRPSYSSPLVELDAYCTVLSAIPGIISSSTMAVASSTAVSSPIPASLMAATAPSAECTE